MTVAARPQEGDYGRREAIVLQSRIRLYGYLWLHCILLIGNVLFFTWAFRRASEKLIDSLDATSLLGLAFFLALAGVILYQTARAIWILVCAAIAAVRDEDVVLIERLFGHWQGSLREIRLRQASFGWITTLGSTRYQVQTVGGSVVGEILMLSEPAKEGLLRLREWLESSEEAECWKGRRVLDMPREVLVQRILSVVRHRPWVGKLLWVAQIMGGYVALGIGVTRFWQLSLVSWFALVFLLMEAFVMLALLGAVRAGGGGRRGVESAVKATQVGLGVFIVSVLWDWLGRLSGMAWLVVVVGFLQAMAIVLEWAVPGSVFLAFTREAHEERESGEREEGGQ
ncbi:MAG: hypothetical protein KatS3mg007_2203 [Thermoanaerobaculum sp.]|nr:MAG: hypothetical protein KatS3mg007_2203 [Thermoanaerobaculum sp.]